MTLRWPVILFDFDGTLVNTINLIVAGYQHSFQTVLGHTWNEAGIKSWIGQSLPEAMEAAAPGRGEELVPVYHQFHHANRDEMTENYPGIADLLWELRAEGGLTGVVTSRSEESTHHLLGVTGMADLIPVLVTHDTTERHKPQPDPIWKALELLEVTPDQAVYVGDAVVDVQAARAAGVASVVLTWGAGDITALTAAAPDAIVADAAELRSVLMPD